MIAFDLRCGGGHVFEAWFASSGSFDDQQARGLVACPLCDDRAISKAPMAPRLSGTGGDEAIDPAAAKAMLRKLAGAQAQMLESSTWVGGDFARQARAMHDGEQPRAVIHGKTSREEARSLMQDGVPVAPLPFPVVPPEERN